MIEYSTLVTGPLGENCYLLWKDSNAWIIDPGADADEITAELAARKLMPVSILLTHGHFDHLGALDALLKQWPEIPVVLRREEWDWAFTHAMNQYPPFYLHQHRPKNLLAPGDTYACGGLSARLLPSPGHTPGGQCILLTDDVPAPICFTGDTIFKGSIGRTDLPGGSFAQLNETLRQLTAALAPETTLLPGHGPATTLAHELKFNPFLQPEEDF